MATTRLYLDVRGIEPSKQAPLKLMVNKNGKTALIHLNVYILPSQWDKRAGKVIGHPNKQFLNTYIGNRKQTIDNLLLKLIESGKLAGLSMSEIKQLISEELSPSSKDRDESKLFSARFLQFANTKKKQSTYEIYMHTYRRMTAYTSSLETLTFDDITKEWLSEFDSFLAKTSPSKNARNIHFRNIRAVFNEAIDDEVTTAYPFRRFKIRPEATAKRSLTVEQLRSVFTFPVEEYAQKYLDMFKLTFFLIGINTIDLCNLKGITSDCRIEYNRSKTGRLYSIKVEPEAMEIINKYPGKKKMLDMLDRYKNYKEYLKHLNTALQRIGKVTIGKNGAKTVKPLFPKLTTYWARHSWATIAASLDIPKETIAAALGHGGNTVTDIYIDFDRKKIDEANRKVMDWVLYGKM